jgi:oligopeptide transport system substrate-binding protein
VPAGTQLAEKQELVRNNGSEPASLDPHKVESDVEFNIISDLFEGLVSVSPTGEIQPRLAEKWENKDNTVWTFHLRPGITWSTARPLPRGCGLELAATGRSENRVTLCQLSGQHAYRQRGRYCSGKKAPETLGVKALNDTTLEVTLTQPNAAFLAMLAHPSLVPVDKVLIGRFGDKWTKPEHIRHQRGV